MKKLLKSMFYSKGRLFMPYIYTFVAFLFVFIATTVKMTAPLGHEFKVNLSDTLILGLWGGIPFLMGVTAWSRSKDKNNEWDGVKKRDSDENTKLD